MATEGEGDVTLLPIAPLTLDATMVDAYAALTDDFNPIHVDAAFAARTEFGRPIAHGTLLIAPLWDYIAPRPAASTEVRFVRPTPVGATVRYWERLDASDGRRFEVRAEDGMILATINCAPSP